MASYDIIGNIAILQADLSNKDEKKLVRELLKRQNIKTIAKKIDRVKGRLRLRKLKIIAGENKFETIYKENSCLMKLNIEKCYFSPRLSDERLKIAQEIARKKIKDILVMFSGVLPYALVIAKFNPNAKVMAIELNRKAYKYGLENIKLNKLKNLESVQGDVKKVVKKIKNKFDCIVMPKPQLKETFLNEAFMLAKKNCIVYYYDFLHEEDFPHATINKIEHEAKRHKKRVKILRYKKSGEIAPYKYRVRVDFIVL